MKRKTQHSTITVGIPTCYGGQSLVETVRSIRKAKNGNTVRIMIIADRTPITPVVADALIKLHGTFVESGRRKSDKKSKTNDRKNNF